MAALPPRCPRLRRERVEERLHLDCIHPSSLRRPGCGRCRGRCRRCLALAPRDRQAGQGYGRGRYRCGKERRESSSHAPVPFGSVRCTQRALWRCSCNSQTPGGSQPEHPCHVPAKVKAPSPFVGQRVPAGFSREPALAIQRPARRPPAAEMAYGGRVVIPQPQHVAAPPPTGRGTALPRGRLGRSPASRDCVFLTRHPSFVFSYACASPAYTEARGRARGEDPCAAAAGARRSHRRRVRRARQPGRPRRRQRKQPHGYGHCADLGCQVLLEDHGNARPVRGRTSLVARCGPCGRSPPAGRASFDPVDVLIADNYAGSYLSQRIEELGTPAATPSGDVTPSSSSPRWRDRIELVANPAAFPR